MAVREFDDLNAFREMLGQALPEGEWLVVDQTMINDFAKATKDYQWIHVDVEKARQFSPFKQPVAHGFLSVALLPKLMEDAIAVKSVKMAVNYGLNKVRFPHPVAVDSRLRLAGQVAAIENYGDDGVKITWQCTVEIEGVDKPACVAELVSLMFE